MTRPKSYDDSSPINRCGTCRHSHFVAYKEHLLCFHGDAIKAEREGPGEFDRSFVEFEGDSVEFLEGDEFDRVWAERVVHSDATCEEWELRDGLNTDGTLKSGREE